MTLKQLFRKYQTTPKTTNYLTANECRLEMIDIVNSWLSDQRNTKKGYYGSIMKWKIELENNLQFDFNATPIYNYYDALSNVINKINEYEYRV